MASSGLGETEAAAAGGAICPTISGQSVCHEFAEYAVTPMLRKTDGLRSDGCKLALWLGGRVCNSACICARHFPNQLTPLIARDSSSFSQTSGECRGSCLGLETSG